MNDSKPAHNRQTDAKFCSTSDFKEEFFCKARQLPERQKVRSVKIYAWLGAIFVMVIKKAVKFLRYRQ